MPEEPAALLRHSRASRTGRASGRPFPIGEPTLGTGRMGDLPALRLRTWCRAGTGVSEIEILIPAEDFRALAEAMVRVSRSATVNAMEEALRRG